MHFTQFHNLAKDRTEIHHLASKKPSPTSKVTDGWQGLCSTYQAQGQVKNDYHD